MTEQGSDTDLGTRPWLDARKPWRGASELTSTTMKLDLARKFSVEQLIQALDKKLFMECTEAQSMVPPVSRALVVTLKVKVRSSKPRMYPRLLTGVSQIDTLERRAKDVLHEVITLRNSLRTVNRVPPEVITLCAAFVSPTDPRPIVPLTHVCRYWRNAITSSPRNWASIGSGWRRLAPLCLERAGVVPLTVEINVSVLGSILAQDKVL